MKKLALIFKFLMLSCVTPLFGAEQPEAAGDWEKRETEAREAIQMAEEAATMQIEREKWRQRLQEQEEAQLATVIKASEAEKKEREEREAQELIETLQQIKEAEAQEKREKKRLEEKALAQVVLEKEKALAKQKTNLLLNPPILQSPAIEKALQQVAEKENRDKEAAIKAVEALDEATYTKELAESQPFLEHYNRTIAPKNRVPFNIIRPEIIQQTKLECGYLAAINSVLVYQGISEKRLPDITKLLSNKIYIENLLKGKQITCRQETLDEFGIINIMKSYSMPNQVYGFYNEQLPTTISQLDETYMRAESDPINIITIFEQLLTTKGFTHIFFLRKSGADIRGVGLGHWISVVAHNNDDTSIDLYILDSQYSMEPEVIHRRNRMNHDKMWQALVMLLRQVDDQMKAAKKT